MNKYNENTYQAIVHFSDGSKIVSCDYLGSEMGLHPNAEQPELFLDCFVERNYNESTKLLKLQSGWSKKPLLVNMPAVSFIESKCITPEARASEFGYGVIEE